MRTYRVPLAYRDRWIGTLDPRLRRMLRICGAIHLVLLLTLLIAPKQTKEAPRRGVPQDRVARMLAPKKPPPPRVTAPTPKPSAQSKAKPPAARAPKPKPQSEPQTSRRTSPTPKRATKPSPPPAGARGRAAGKAVAKQIEDTTANIDDMLAGITGTVRAPAGSGSGSGGGKSVASGVDQVQGGRGAGQLASIDGLLEGTGAGAGASSKGVARSGVDVVDDGMETDGAGSTAWGRDSRSLMAVVQRYKSGVKFCYDNELKKAPNLNGKITLQMDILASGAVSNLQIVGDTLGAQALQRCILAQVRNWRFQAIDSGTVRFTLPLVFSPPN